jgi:hypothetical protein
MYHPVLGTFQSRDPLPETDPVLMGTSLYEYVGNNPINYTDPSGMEIAGPRYNPYGPPDPQPIVNPVKLKNPVCGPRVWLYTGSYCVEQDVWQDATEAGGRVVTCWWECEVTTHKCVAGKILTTVEVVSGIVGSPSVRIGKWPDPVRVPGQDVTSLSRWLAARFGQRATGPGATAIGQAAKTAGRSSIAIGAKLLFVFTLYIEAGVSAVCGYQCNK